MGGMANVLGDKRVGKARRDVLPWVYLMVFLVGIVAVVGFTWYHIANERRGALEHWRARLFPFAASRAPWFVAGGAGGRADAEVLAGSPAVRAVLSGEGDRGVAGQLERV